MKKNKSFRLSPLHLAFLLIFVSLIFLTAFIGTITGSSVYYQTTDTPIIKNPTAAVSRNLDAQQLSVNKLSTLSISTPSGNSLALISQDGVYIDGETGLSVSALSGLGNAYACLDKKGKLYRSDKPCA